MRKTVRSMGLEELKCIRNKSQRFYGLTALFSVFSNLLVLTGPIYMLHVYDRVLGSGSVETLITLSVLMVFLFFAMGVLDFIRGRLMTRIGAKFQADLEPRVFDAVMRSSITKNEHNYHSGLLDLENVKKFICSQGAIAFFDLPWSLFFIILIFLFHPVLGYLALSGIGLLTIVTLANHFFAKIVGANSEQAVLAAFHISNQLRDKADLVFSLGMKEAAFSRWASARKEALLAQNHCSDLAAVFGTFSKTIRLVLQSAMLGAGAFLVIKQEMTPGLMIASTILLGRIMAPIDTVLNQWETLQRSVNSWRRLAELIETTPLERNRIQLRRPASKLSVEAISVLIPGQQKLLLHSISFEVLPGEAVAVIGPSGSGKSSLAKALIALWPCCKGSIKLDSAAIDDYSPYFLGKLVGYLPQKVDFLDGTVAENIARFDPEMSPEKIIDASKLAGTHELILNLPHGYDTKIAANLQNLSGGQLQRIGLARALYDQPAIIVLDEPDAHLDDSGLLSLIKTIRALKNRGCGVILMAHRPMLIQECAKVLLLDGGVSKGFGQKDRMLRSVPKVEKSKHGFERSLKEHVA